MAAISSKEANAYLIDPLTAPEPSAETGLNSHFTAPTESTASSSPRTSTVASNNPYRSSLSGSQHSRHRSDGSRGSGDHKTSPRVHYTDAKGPGTPPSYEVATGQPSSSGRRRGSSLTARYPGDESHKPLDLIRKDSKKAHRSPHLSKRGLPGTDSIDRLDPTNGSIPYHHEGPYDAATLARNRDAKTAPIAALKSSNEEALKATPVENVKDSLARHVPLDGTAQIPPGHEDRFGRRYDYEQGENLMISGNPAGGAYKRYEGVPGLSYRTDDIGGVGEPAYSRELARRTDDLNLGKEERGEIEMTDHAASADSSDRARSGSGIANGLKKRIGSLKKKHNHAE